MRIQNVKKLWFSRIRYNGRVYKRVDKPVIGGIAEALKSDKISTKGQYYQIDDFIWKDGDEESTAIIGDDGECCGMHRVFANRLYYFYK